LLRLKTIILFFISGLIFGWITIFLANVTPYVIGRAGSTPALVTQ
jgi:hypothetical protein